MFKSVLEERIRSYNPANELEQENILQETMQYIILFSLSRCRFFERALFHGGSHLRIFHHLSRFSEDLDFLARTPDTSFKWGDYLQHLKKDTENLGIQFEILDKSEVGNSVRKSFLKTDSIGKLLILELPFTRDSRKKVRIKLEIDTNPPAGSEMTIQYINFPTLATVATQTLESSFSLKTHALLCRKFIKGRDWFDFIWYVSNRKLPNLQLLSNAIQQVGPWQNKGIKVTQQWLIDALKRKVEEIDWEIARKDVEPFIPIRDRKGISLWSTQLFLYFVDQLNDLFTATSNVPG